MIPRQRKTDTVSSRLAANHAAAHPGGFYLRECVVRLCRLVGVIEHICHPGPG